MRRADVYLTVAEAARQKRVQVRAVLRAIADERLTATKVGRIWLIRPEDLDEYQPLAATGGGGWNKKP
jgi:excisionase family DNA binding protein